MIQSKKNKRFLVVSYSQPDRASGTPVVIRRFLENFNKDEVVLIGRPTRKNEKVLDAIIHYPTIIIPTPPIGFPGEKIWSVLSSILSIIVGLVAVLMYKPQAILTFYRDESSLFAGLAIHKITNIPLFPYFCDLYLENFKTGYSGKLAKWLQPKIFKHAKEIFVLTEAMKDYYKNVYGIKAIVLPHCNNRSVMKNPIKTPQEGPLKIAYLGNIDDDRIISFRSLTKAIEGDNQFFLYYLTPAPPSLLENKGLLIKNSMAKFISSENLIHEEMANCDVLFLAAVTKNREWQMKTGFHTKIIDYLICQKPILAHTKRDYFMAQFLDTHNCGIVVEGGTKELAEALQNIRSDDQLRFQLSNSSGKTLSYFDGKSIASQFRRIVFL